MPDTVKLNKNFYINIMKYYDAYLKDKERNNFFNEINNQETFEKILEIYNILQIKNFY